MGRRLRFGHWLRNSQLAAAFGLRATRNATGVLLVNFEPEAAVGAADVEVNFRHVGRSH